MSINAFAANLMTLSDDELRKTSRASYVAYRRDRRSTGPYQECLACSQEWIRRELGAEWDAIVDAVKEEELAAEQANRERMQ